MELFVQDLKSDNIETRLSAINNITSIANALGPAKTESELIPFIAENVQDEDEIFFGLANQMILLMNFIPDKDNPACLTPLFNVLMSIEEGCVREKAINAFKEICSKLSNEVIEQTFFPIVIDLAKAIWFPKKICACQLITFIFPLVSDDKKMQLMTSFASLASADMPLVRRNAAMKLGQMAQFVYNANLPIPQDLKEKFEDFKQYCNTSDSSRCSNAFIIHHYIYPILLRITQDEQDTIRVLATEELFKVTKLVAADLNTAGVDKILMPSIMYVINDQSWRVRTVCTSVIIKFLSVLPYETFSKVAEAKYLAYIRDTENEVKVRALNNLPDFIDCLNPDDQKRFIKNDVLPKLDVLVNAKHIQIKIALSKAIIALSKYLTKSEITTHLLDSYMVFLRDENSDISLATLSKLTEMGTDYIALDELSSCIFDSISTLIRDGKWRIRDEIVQLLPTIISALGFESETSDELMKTLIRMLGDNVYAIRETVGDAIYGLVKKQGILWANNTVIPMINEMKNSGNYIVRMSYIDNISRLLEFFSFDGIIDNFKTLKEAANDPVPNVRFRLILFFKAKLYDLAKSSNDHKHTELAKNIVEIVKTLAQDADTDVNDFANDFMDQYKIK